MFKIAPVTLTVALGVAGLAQGLPAEAHPNVSVGSPSVAQVEPLTYAPAYYAPYYLTHARYWRHGYDRFRRDRFRHEHWRRC
jgi:hypothetical protein